MQWVETEYCQTLNKLLCLQIDRWDCPRRFETLRHKMCNMGTLDLSLTDTAFMIAHENPKIKNKKVTTMHIDPTGESHQ
eukprot:3111922-Karenia_brevis.AAC.1